MNSAMASLSENVGQDVPTFNEVRDEIELRYARAKGMAEIQGSSVEARARLDQIRAELGVQPGANAIDTPSPPA